MVCQPGAFVGDVVCHVVHCLLESSHAQSSEDVDIETTTQSIQFYQFRTLPFDEAVQIHDKQGPLHVPHDYV